MRNAFSHGLTLHEIGSLRYRAACVQNAWHRKLFRMRRDYQRSKQNTCEKENQNLVGVPGGKESRKAKLDVTLKEVRGEMRPFICMEMD